MWQTKNYWYFKPSNAYSYSCYNSEEKKQTKSISMYLLNYQFVIMSLDINFPRKVILINL